jgi:ribokinase
LGPDGALVAEKLANGEVKIGKVEAPKVKAVDTTGAGDCFCGSLVYFLAEHPELTPVEAAQKAVQIAAISVQRPGPMNSYPSAEELKQLGIL